ncbi:MAG: alpha/beta hydrolase [Firmicutes bacterium]|nr:alpha/beta hydrolase [Bacillota bacterium]MBR6025426.1 alpha/beta hydrolase [Bacillota bacterium]
MYEEWEVTIPSLTGDEMRRAFVYVPDEAQQNPEARFPVLYMFDGQNLFFDEQASFGKSWGLLDYLTEHNVPLIIAATECSHHAEEDPCGGRLSEYSPFSFSDESWGSIEGRGEITMDYYVREFKPFIDAHFPTMPERRYTFIGGSSMGGLMTIYALMKYNDVFSRGAALSPSLEFSFEDIMDMIECAKIGRTHLYMDNGSKEMLSVKRKRAYAEVAAALIKKGVYLESRIIPGGTHSEESWQNQVPFFIEALFYHL